MNQQQIGKNNHATQNCFPQFIIFFPVETCYYIVIMCFAHIHSVSSISNQVFEQLVSSLSGCLFWLLSFQRNNQFLVAYIPKLLIFSLKNQSVAYFFKICCLFFQQNTSQLLNFSKFLTSCKMVAYRGCLQKILSVCELGSYQFQLICRRQLRVYASSSGRVKVLLLVSNRKHRLGQVWLG